MVLAEKQQLVSIMLEHGIEWKKTSAYKNREEADKQADQAKKKVAHYKKNLIEITLMVKDMERFAEKILMILMRYYRRRGCWKQENPTGRKR